MARSTCRWKLGTSEERVDVHDDELGRSYIWVGTYPAARSGTFTLPNQSHCFSLLIIYNGYTSHIYLCPYLIVQGTTYVLVNYKIKQLMPSASDEQTNYLVSSFHERHFFVHLLLRGGKLLGQVVALHGHSTRWMQQTDCERTSGQRHMKILRNPTRMCTGTKQLHS